MGNRLRVIMVLTCVGLSRIEVVWRRRCLFFDGHVTVVHELNGGKKIIVPPFAYLQEEELWKESDNIPFPEILGYYQDALLKAGKEILRVANYDVLYMLKAYDEVKERDPLRGTCLLEAAQQLNEWLMHNNEASSDMIVYKINQLQISRHQRQFSDYERIFLIDVIKSDQFNATPEGRDLFDS